MAVLVKYVEKAGFEVQISGPDILIPIIHQVFADSEKAAVADFKSGKQEIQTRPLLVSSWKHKANPQVALKLLA